MSQIRKKNFFKYSNSILLLFFRSGSWVAKQENPILFSLKLIKVNFIFFSLAQDGSSGWVLVRAKLNSGLCVLSKLSTAEPPGTHAIFFFRQRTWYVYLKNMYTLKHSSLLHRLCCSCTNVGKCTDVKCSESENYYSRFSRQPLPFWCLRNHAIMVRKMQVLKVCIVMKVNLII
jgi:hypothetical protein